MNHLSDFHKSISRYFLIVPVLLITLVFDSCVSNKQAVYVQTQDGKVVKPDFQPYLKSTRTIQPDDELYIRVKSDDDLNNNVSISRDDTYLANTDITLLTYTVNEQGFIRYPNIGEIKLHNLTLDEAGKAMEKALVGFLSYPTVTVKFTLKNVTVLGEVNNQAGTHLMKSRLIFFRPLVMLVIFHIMVTVKKLCC